MQVIVSILKCIFFIIIVVVEYALKLLLDIVTYIKKGLQ